MMVVKIWKGLHFCCLLHNVPQKSLTLDPCDIICQICIYILDEDKMKILYDTYYVS